MTSTAVATVRQPRRRVVTWALPRPTPSILGTPTGFGLTWLLGVDRPSEALAIALRQALATDAIGEGTDR